MTFQHQVAVDFVAEDHHIIFPRQCCHLALHLGGPGDADGVVGVAQHHQLWPFGFEDMLQSLKVHLVETVIGAPEGIVHHHAVVARDEHPEGVIYRFLDYHLVTRSGEMVQHKAEAIHDAADEARLIRRELQAVALTLPVDDGLPIVLKGHAVAIDGVLGDAVGQCLGDVRTGRKAHVGHPQR